MKIWVILQLTIDLILFLIIIIYIIRGGKKEGGKEMPDQKEISQLTAALKEILADSENISYRLTEQIAAGEHLINILDEKIKRADNVAVKDPGTSKIPSSPQPDERYRTVSGLLEQGLSAGDISKRAGIPIGEVELIINLSGERR